MLLFVADATSEPLLPKSVRIEEFSTVHASKHIQLHNILNGIGYRVVTLDDFFFSVLAIMESQFDMTVKFRELRRVEAFYLPS